MNTLNQLIHNQIFISAVMGWLIAQVLKTIIHLYFTKSFVPERLVGSGGMPSSHSATVCALSTATLYQCGIESAEFAIACIVAIIVMYDAIGVRRETGIQAKVLNEMMQMFEKMNHSLSTEERLKEFVGHTPFQVLIGSILGVLIAIFINNLFFV